MEKPADSLEAHMVQSVLRHLASHPPTYKLIYTEIIAEHDPHFPLGHQPRLRVKRGQVLIVELVDRKALRTPSVFAAQGRIAWSFEWHHAIKGKKELCREALEALTIDRCIEDGFTTFVDIEKIIHLGH